MNDPLSRYMLFSINEQRYAIEVEDVAEIAEMIPAYPIPFSPLFMRGVVNIHGKLAAVLDLALFSGSGAATKGGNLLLLNRPDTSLALMVEQIERIISRDEIMSSEAAEGFLEKARLILADGPVIQLSIEALLDGIEGVLER